MRHSPSGLGLSALLLAALLAAGGRARAGDEPPRGRLPADVTPLRYALVLTVDPRQQRFSGEVEIEVRMEAPTARIWLHGLGLTVKEATLRTAGRTLPVRYAEVDALRGVARLDLPGTVDPGTGTLRFVYDAPFQRGPTGLARFEAGGDAYAFTQLEAVYARRVFPAFDEPGRKTPFEVTVLAPPGNEVVGNAPLESRTDLGNGLVRHRLQATPPLPTYLLALAVGPYDVVEGRPVPPSALRPTPLPLRGVAVRGMGPKLAHALEVAPPLVLALERYMDIAFPYPKLDLVATPVQEGAMENAGAIVEDEGLLLVDQGSSPHDRRAFLEILAHELAHQWFGDLVTPAWWDDIWLNESFAEWMGVRIARELRPDLVPATEMIDEALRAMETDAKSSGRAIRQEVEDSTAIESAFDAITYLKGGGVLSMVESFVGPERFRAGVRLHLRRHLHGTATGDEFFAAMAEASGQPGVVEAFRSFVEQAGLPLVTVERSSAGELRFAQSRYSPVGSSVRQGQRWTLPLCTAFHGDDRSARRCTLMNGATASVEVPPEVGATVAVMPNADGAGYYRFALPEPDTRALLKRAAKLNDGEALALADSVAGAFRAGRVRLRTVVEGAAALAGHPSWQAATKLGPMLAEVADRMLTPGERAVLRRRLAEIYAPRLDATGSALDARAGADDPADVRELRSRLVSLVALAGGEPGLRARLRTAALRSLDDPGALDRALRPLAWAVAAEEKAPGVLDALGRHLVADDPSLRNDAALALGLIRDPGVAERARALAEDERVLTSDAVYVLRLQLAHAETRPGAWRWLQTNFDRMVPRLGIFRGRAIEALGAFCEPAARREVAAFGNTEVPRLGTGQLELDRALESIDLCVALRAHHAKEFRALARR